MRNENKLKNLILACFIVDGFELVLSTNSIRKSTGLDYNTTEVLLSKISRDGYIISENGNINLTPPGVLFLKGGGYRSRIFSINFMSRIVTKTEPLIVTIISTLIAALILFYFFGIS